MTESLLTNSSRRDGIIVLYTAEQFQPITVQLIATARTIGDTIMT